jgi:putative FmdB family regulatory protein
MPRYAFGCRACGLEFEVSRAMSDAARPATCPVDGKDAERIFTVPMTAVRQAEGGASAPPAGAPGARGWSSPFFPPGAPSVGPGRPASTTRHELPSGSSKPTRFRHFGHWHPAGTPAHSHPRRPPPKAPPPSEA